MINRITDSKTARFDAVARGGAASKTDPVVASEAAGAPQSAVAQMVANGPPLDMAKIQIVKAAIAEGRYPVDPLKIAEEMMMLGFGRTR